MYYHSASYQQRRHVWCPPSLGMWSSIADEFVGEHCFCCLRNAMSFSGRFFLAGVLFARRMCLCENIVKREFTRRGSERRVKALVVKNEKVVRKECFIRTSGNSSIAPPCTRTTRQRQLPRYLQPNPHWHLQERTIQTIYHS